MTIECDEITCQRVGSLAGFGWTDQAIADALLLSLEQVAWAKETAGFKANFARYGAERVEKAITVAEGWDYLEEKAIERIGQAMEYNSDPRFALQVARVANQAHRRTEGRGDRIIDAQKPQVEGPKVINLTLNRNYINISMTGEDNAAINMQPREVKVLPRRQADVPTPKAVSELLAPARKQIKKEQDAFLEGLDFAMDEAANE